jgi:hypothetical protein
MSTPSSVAARPLVVDNTFIELPRIPSACTGLMNRVSDVFWERRFNLRTAGRRDVRFEDAVHYEPLPYYAMFKVLERLRLKRDDVFVDVGSGMGRAVCVAATHPVAASLGVEIEPELNAIAEDNARNMRGRRAEIRLRCESATDFNYDAATVLWIFNPFGAATMSKVLARVEASWRAHPRPLRIAYINATCAHVFAAQPWLQLEDAWPMSAWSRVKTPVQFYRTR